MFYKAQVGKVAEHFDQVPIYHLLYSEYGLMFSSFQTKSDYIKEFCGNPCRQC